MQLTPPGSGCSIGFGISVSEMKPGELKGVQLVVEDIQRAREELVGRGVDATPVYHFENGKRVDGPGDAWNSFVSFDDPDGNHWTVQERPASAGLATATASSSSETSASSRDSWMHCHSWRLAVAQRAYMAAASGL